MLNIDITLLLKKYKYYSKLSKTHLSTLISSISTQPTDIQHTLSYFILENNTQNNDLNSKYNEYIHPCYNRDSLHCNNTSCNNKNILLCNNTPCNNRDPLSNNNIPYPNPWLTLNKRINIPTTTLLFYLFNTTTPITIHNIIHPYPHYFINTCSYISAHIDIRNMCPYILKYSHIIYKSYSNDILIDLYFKFSIISLHNYNLEIEILLEIKNIIYSYVVNNKDKLEGVSSKDKLEGLSTRGSELEGLSITTNEQHTINNKTLYYHLYTLISHNVEDNTLFKLLHNYTTLYPLIYWLASIDMLLTLNTNEEVLNIISNKIIRNKIEVSNMLKGVNDKTSSYKGVSMNIDNYEGVINSTSKQRSVNNRLNTPVIDLYKSFIYNNPFTINNRGVKLPINVLIYSSLRISTYNENNLLSYIFKKEELYEEFIVLLGKYRGRIMYEDKGGLVTKPSLKECINRKTINIEKSKKCIKIQKDGEVFYRFKHFSLQSIYSFINENLLILEELVPFIHRISSFLPPEFPILFFSSTFNNSYKLFYEVFRKMNKIEINDILFSDENINRYVPFINLDDSGNSYRGVNDRDSDYRDVVNTTSKQQGVSTKDNASILPNNTFISSMIHHPLFIHLMLTHSYFNKNINNSILLLLLPYNEIRYLYLTYKLPLLSYLHNIRCKEYMCVIKGCNYKCKEHLCDKMYFEHNSVCYEQCKCVCSYRGVSKIIDDYKGVSNKDSNLKGIEYINTTDILRGVDYNGINLKGIEYINTTDILRGVNNKASKQEGVNNCTDILDPNNRDKDHIGIVKNIIPLIHSVNDLLTNNTLLLHTVIEKLECIVISLRNNTHSNYCNTNVLLIEHLLLPLILVRVIPLIVDNGCYSYLRFFLENTSSYFIHSMCYCMGMKNIDVMSECIGVLLCDVDKVLRHVIEHEKVCECLSGGVRRDEQIEGVSNSTDKQHHFIDKTTKENVIPVETLKEYLDTPFGNSFISYISKHYPLSSILLITPSYLSTVFQQHLKYFPMNNLEIIKYVINNEGDISDNTLLVNSFYVPFNEQEIFKYLLSIRNISLLDIFIRQRELYYNDKGGVSDKGSMVGVSNKGSMVGVSNKGSLEGVGDKGNIIGLDNNTFKQQGVSSSTNKQVNKEIIYAYKLLILNTFINPTIEEGVILYNIYKDIDINISIKGNIIQQICTARHIRLDNINIKDINSDNKTDINKDNKTENKTDINNDNKTDINKDIINNNKTDINRDIDNDNKTDINEDNKHVNTLTLVLTPSIYNIYVISKIRPSDISIYMSDIFNYLVSSLEETDNNSKNNVSINTLSTNPISNNTTNTLSTINTNTMINFILKTHFSNELTLFSIIDEVLCLLESKKEVIRYYVLKNIDSSVIPIEYIYRYIKRVIILLNDTSYRISVISKDILKSVNIMTPEIRSIWYLVVKSMYSSGGLSSRRGRLEGVNNSISKQQGFSNSTITSNTTLLDTLFNITYNHYWDSVSVTCLLHVLCTYEDKRVYDILKGLKYVCGYDVYISVVEGVIDMLVSKITRIGKEEVLLIESIIKDLRCVIDSRIGVLDKLESVSEGIIEQQGVSEGIIEQQGVNNSICEQPGVNDSSSKQQGVNNSICEQQGVNESSIERQDVNESVSKQQGVNNSVSNNDTSHILNTPLLTISHKLTPLLDVNYGYNTSCLLTPILTILCKRCKYNLLNNIPLNSMLILSSNSITIEECYSVILSNINVLYKWCVSNDRKVRSIGWKGIEGVISKGTELEGVSNSTDDYKDVTNSNTKQHPLGGSNITLHPVNIRTNKQQGIIIWLVGVTLRSDSEIKREAIEVLYRYISAKGATNKEFNANTTFFLSALYVLRNDTHLRVRKRVNEVLFTCLDNINTFIKNNMLYVFKCLELLECKGECVEGCVTEVIDKYEDIIWDIISSSRSDRMEGVSDKESNYKGVSEKDSNYKGVVDKDINYKGVSDKDSNYRGVSNKDSNYKGVSDISNTLHPFNTDLSCDLLIMFMRVLLRRNRKVYEITGYCLQSMNLTIIKGLYNIKECKEKVLEIIYKIYSEIIEDGKEEGVNKTTSREEGVSNKKYYDLFVNEVLCYKGVSEGLYSKYNDKRLLKYIKDSKEGTVDSVGMEGGKEGVNLETNIESTIVTSPLIYTLKDIESLMYKMLEQGDRAKYLETIEMYCNNNSDNTLLCTIIKECKRLYIKYML